MPGSFVIDYKILDGGAVNPDASAPAIVNACATRTISVNQAGWGQLKQALVFDKPESRLQIPTQKRFSNAGKFFIEMLVRPTELTSEKMSLMQGQVLPVRLGLERKNGVYELCGEVKTKSGWRKATCAKVTIPLNAWTSVGLAYTGSDLMLFKNNEVVARLVLDDPRLDPLGEQNILVGASYAGGAEHYTGEIAGIRIQDSLSPEILISMAPVFAAGLGEIESKYQSLGGETGFLGAPLAAEKVIGKGRMRTYHNGNIYWSAAGGAHEVHGGILVCYNQKQGPLGVLGFPTTDEFNALKAGARVSRFENGAIYWSAATGAHEVHQYIFARYLALGGEKGFLGLPKTDEIGVAAGGRCDFEGGSIYRSELSGAYEVHGAILQRYQNLNANAGFLGFPISNEEKVLKSNGQDSGMRVSRFQSGTIYWKAATGAWEVHGAIRSLYESLGGSLGRMGSPLTNESAVSGTDIRYNDFEKGIIVWRPGIGAKEITKLALRIGQVTCGKIDDGVNVPDFWNKDKTAELITYLTVRVNGATLVNNQRRPAEHAGSSYNVNYPTDISPVSHNTEIYWKVSVDDWDAASGNDYLGRREETYNIRNLWGTQGGNPPGIYVDQPATNKGGDAPSLSTLLFDYSIQIATPLDPNKHFREQYWWKFDNFNTATLTRSQFADTFRDVDHVDGWWDKVWNPIDTAIYELMYKGLASKGNCYGMSLEGIYARTGNSIFIEPLFQYAATAASQAQVNLRHGYQIGDSEIRWYIAKLASLVGVTPLGVYASVKQYLAMGDYPVVSMFDLEDFVGHTVMPYKCVDGPANNPHRIYVADPNRPWNEAQGDASWIEIGKNNTFKLTQSDGTSSYKTKTALAGMLPLSFIMDMPFHQMSSAPRTPFWEILIGLSLLLGGLIILAGEAETEQVASGVNAYYKQQSGKKWVVANGLPNFQRIPFIDFQGRPPELYAQIGRLPGSLALQVRGRKNGQYTHHLRTPLSAVQITSPIIDQALDQISVLSANSATPLYILQTSQPVKSARVNVYSALDLEKGDYRRFEADLQLANGSEAKMGFQHDGGILLQPAGATKPIGITIETRLNNILHRSQMKYTPVNAGELIILRPLDWTAQLNQIVIERLTGLGGTVIDRNLMPAVPLP